MSPISSGPLSERKEIEVLEESLREQAAELAALREAVRALKPNYERGVLGVGFGWWDIPAVRRALEEER